MNSDKRRDGMTGKFKFGDQVVYDNGKEKVEGIFQRKFGGTKSSIMTQSSMVICEDSEISAVSGEEMPKDATFSLISTDQHVNYLVDSLKKSVCRSDYPVSVLRMWLENHIKEAENRAVKEIRKEQ